jgi:Glycosyltransferases, probably involved in cell wall biogenesis
MTPIATRTTTATSHVATTPATDVTAPVGARTGYGVSVVIPTRRGRYPHQVLDFLTQTTYDGEVEIVIVEGSSPSLQRNEAVRQCNADIVYFLDDDSYVSPAAITEGTKILSDSRIAVVGGPALTYENASIFELCIGEAFSSIFGGCITRGRAKPMGKVRLVEGEELVLCNLMMRKSAYLEASGLRTTLYPGEDPEMVKRLRRRGELICYHPGMIVSRTRRKTIKAFVKQCFAYGSGRGQHICEGTRARDLLFLVPSAFLIYLFAFACTPNLVTAIPLIAYAVLAYLSASFIGFINRSLPMALYMMPIFFIMHCSYGAGLIFGLVSYGLKLQRKRSSEIKITLLPLSQVESHSREFVSNDCN